jgi:hypothetical protein
MHSTINRTEEIKENVATRQLHLTFLLHFKWYIPPSPDPPRYAPSGVSDSGKGRKKIFLITFQHDIIKICFQLDFLSSFKSFSV